MTDAATPAAAYPARRAVEAHDFWRQYEVTVDFAKDPPAGEFVEYVGTVEALRETKNTEGEWVPRLAIRGDDGVLMVVTAHQSRLRAELVLSAPAVGDRIAIRYLGPDPKAPRGMNPVKRFAVRSYTPPPAPEPEPEEAG